MAANILMIDKNFFRWFRKTGVPMAAHILMIDRDQGFTLSGLPMDGLADTREHVRKPFESWLPVR